MIPAIWPKDVLVIERMDIQQVRRGDVVLCRRAFGDGAGFVAHRVVASVDFLQTLAFPQDPVFQIGRAHV